MSFWNWRRSPGTSTSVPPTPPPPVPAPPLLCPKCSCADAIDVATLKRRTPGYEPVESGMAVSCAKCGYIYLALRMEGVQERNVAFKGDRTAPAPAEHPADPEQPRERIETAMDRIMGGLRWRNPKV